jgi:hypothetical protein
MFAFFLPVSAANSYTLADVEKHNQPSDCWSIFDKSVYDLTTYLSSHDRYMDIRDWCGKDMTIDFQTKAGEGVDHKNSSYSLLEVYKIGEYSTVTPTIATTETPKVTASESTEDEEYSVEVEGQVMKTLTIQQIADMWKIDSNKLLAEIIRTYSFKNSYTTSTVLDDMRAEYKFSPSQIKDIAEAIKNNTNNNVVIPNQQSTDNTVVVTRNTNNPYMFWEIFFGTIILYVATYYLSVSDWGKKNFKLINFNLIWNSVLILSLIPSVIFGFYLIARYSFPELAKVDFDFMYWHVEGSIIFATAGIAHLVQRLKQYLLPIKLILKDKSAIKIVD